MAQMVTRMPEDLLDEVDELVAAGIVGSRSDAVRTALRELVASHRRRREAEATVDGYTRLPQTDEEVGWADEATHRMIAAEPW